MIEDIAALTENDADRDLFRASLHKLFSSSFIMRGVKGDEEQYSFIIRNRGAFEAYCDCAGWTLRVDETLGVVSWKGPSPARLLLSKDETVMLIILRLLYDEKRNEISLLEFPAVTVLDLNEKYRTLVGAQMRKTRMTEVLRRFSTLRLVRTDGTDVGFDTLVMLYPSLLFALDGDAVAALHAKISKDARTAAPQADDEVEETDADQVE